MLLFQDHEKCDFGPIREHLDKLKEKKKEMTKEDKDKLKLEKEALQRKYGFALLDDNRVEKVRTGMCASRPRLECRRRWRCCSRLAERCAWLREHGCVCACACVCLCVIVCVSVSLWAFGVALL